MSKSKTHIMTSLSIVVFFTSILLLSSSVNAFISTSNQPIKNTHISTSLLSAYIDENYPHATTTRGVKEEESINGNNSKEQKQPTTTNTKRPSKTLPNGAKLTLVGAGPGSPDLLTLAAHKIITNPNNYLIVDRLVSQEILDLIQGEYKVANKYRGCADIAQEEIYDWCKDGLREGKHVVRLKIGKCMHIIIFCVHILYLSYLVFISCVCIVNHYKEANGKLTFILLIRYTTTTKNR